MNISSATSLPAVVLASSSRSGSTWLATMLIHALQLQGVFEPLHPKFNDPVRLLTGFDPQQDHASSFYLRSGRVDPEWDQVLAAALVGQPSNTWTSSVLNVPSQRGYLVKMIRANLMLGYLCDRFQPKLIYLVRHPCAVVNSRLRMRWATSAQALLRQEDLVEDYLAPWVAEIERETDVAGLHALWWAVENLVAQRELATRPHHRVFYEHLVINPEQEIAQAVAFTGLPAEPVPEAVINHLSWTSRRSGLDAAIVPLVSWQEELPPEQQARVLAWVQRLGIPWYGADIAPIQGAAR